MAEIHVERKRKSLWWLWLLIIIILAVAVYIWYTNNQDSGALGSAANSITAAPAELTFLSQFYI
ncbi:MAG TPA: hypothetical protein VGE15_09590 [Sphingobacteriaceae bacterium]